MRRSCPPCTTTSPSRPRVRCSTRTGKAGGHIERVVRDAAAWVERQGAHRLQRPEAGGGAGARPHTSHPTSSCPPPSPAARTPCCSTATWTSSPSSAAGAATSGPWTPKVDRRQALRPRRRRRRLRHLRQPHRAAGAGRCRASRARAVSDSSRPARRAAVLICRSIHRPAAPALWQCEPRGLPGQRRWRLRAALAHHLACAAT